MGRIWQTLLLSLWQPAFAWLPVETPVKNIKTPQHILLLHQVGKLSQQGFKS